MGKLACRMVTSYRAVIHDGGVLKTCGNAW